MSAHIQQAKLEIKIDVYIYGYFRNYDGSPILSKLINVLVILHTGIITGILHRYKNIHRS